VSRFFICPEAVKGERIVINGKEAHHILDVMRLKVSDSVVTFDGTGKEYSGIIKNVSRNSLTVEITATRTLSGKGQPRIILIQALPRKAKMDYIVEKATELGVHAIVPVIAERTVPVWNEEKMRAHVQRWTKIATAAAKQCGRLDIPQVFALAKFKDALEKLAGVNLKLIAVLSEEAVPLKEVIRGSGAGQIAIAIGPEGDFTAGEAEYARSLAFKAVDLGPRVLKSDTAGLALLSILNYELSN